MTNLAEEARRLKPRRTARGRLLPRLILMTDSVRLPDPLSAIVRLPRGSAVILRHYDDGAPDGTTREALARRLLADCRRCGVLLLIAGDAQLAAAIGADGLHLPEHQLRHGPRRWRLWRRPLWIVTAAAHGPAALCQARCAGADAALLSPVFPTASHPGAATLGPLRFARLAGATPMPVYAVGGISGTAARRLRGAQPAGFAGIGGLRQPAAS